MGGSLRQAIRSRRLAGIKEKMPLTDKGQKIMASMKKQYGEKKGTSVFYASRNKGTITGVDPESRLKAGLTRRKG